MDSLVSRSSAVLVSGSALLMSAASPAAPQEATSRVEVLTENGMAILGYYEDSPSFLAPLTSLSPLVKRAALRSGAFEFEVGNFDPDKEISVVGLVHSADEFVVLDGSRPLVVGDVEAPAAARTAARERVGPLTWDLPHLVRRDRNYAGLTVASPLTLVPAPPKSAEDSAKRLLLIFGEDRGEEKLQTQGLRVDGIDAAVFSHVLRPLVIDASARQTRLQISADHSSPCFIDAAMYATPVPPRKELPLTLAIADSPTREEPKRVRCPMSAELAEALQDPNTSLTLWLRIGSASQETTSSGPVDRLVETSGDSAPLRAVARDSGIYAVHFEGDAEQLDIRPTMGPGAAWGDIDGDGQLDLVILQGSGRAGTEPLADKIYLGRQGRFQDVTRTAGLGRGDAGMGALLFDVNGDGPLDLYCANYGQDRLFLGKGDGTFTEATDLLPALDLWSAGIAAADYDGDGDLDIYITSYLDYDTDKMPPEEELGRYQREDPVEMLPFAFPGQRNVFLRNQLVETGELGFEDVTEALGLLDVQGRGMQPVFWDFDRDGDQDLYVANDVSFNVLFRNEGDGTFKDVSFSTGLDDPRGGMGLALGDVDRDGDEDVFLTNWQLEANALYLNSIISSSSSKRRRASFHDYTVRSKLGPSGIGVTSWGPELFDLDLDGDLDLYVANGYTSPDYESTGICVGQVDQLFLGDGTGKFAQVPSGETGVGQIVQASRGAIGADYDGDGDVDLLVTANNGRAELLRNQAERKGRWVGVRLRQPGPNTRAVGAEVTITLMSGATFRRALRAGQGYLTGNPAELHFGLGKAEAIKAIEVLWPDGERTTTEGELDAWQTVTR